MSVRAEKRYGNLVQLTSDNQMKQYNSWNSLRFGYGLGNTGIQGRSKTIEKILNQDYAFCKDTKKLSCLSLETLQKTYHELAQTFLTNARMPVTANGTSYAFPMMTTYLNMMEHTMAIIDKLEGLNLLFF